jgi:hypothetical protein
MKCDHCDNPFSEGQEIATIPTAKSELFVHDQCFDQLDQIFHLGDMADFRMTGALAQIPSRTFHGRQFSKWYFTDQNFRYKAKFGGGVTQGNYGQNLIRTYYVRKATEPDDWQRKLREAMDNMGGFRPKERALIHDFIQDKWMRS